MNTRPRLVVTMTQHEHDAQRHLVALSLLLCPPGGRHPAKGHESKDAVAHAPRS